MQLQPPRGEAIIGARRRARLAPVIRTVGPYIREEKVRVSLVIAFFVAHVPLAILMDFTSYVATIHSFVTVGCGLWLAAFSPRIERVVYAAAYITGAEVLWRMTEAQSFWEIGKYGVAAIFIVAMIRHRRLNPSLLPLAYFVLLVPSTLLTLQSLPLSESRALLSDNMSGPFAVMAAGCFLSQLSLSRSQLLRVFLGLVGPLIGVAAVAFFGVASAKRIRFGGESSLIASGGFGPNQVSSMLGLGALACFLILLDKNVSVKLRTLCAGLMISMGAQSALTFSRGGLYNVAGAIVLASLFLLKDPRTRIRFALSIVFILGISYFVVFPRLDNFTKGALSRRFQDTEMTGREDIVRADMSIWADNVILGVGPGLAKQYREEFGPGAAAHTEFTRLLAEHGVFGLFALLVFVAAAVRNVIKAHSAHDRAVTIAITAWSFFFMLNAAMRLVAPAMMFALAFAQFRLTAREAHELPKQEPEAMPGLRLKTSVFSRADNPIVSKRSQTRISPTQVRLSKM